ncbi:MAG TPA: hypothetical protein VM577_14945 [Anaerovoracaceae bacterium]|nr:hypothetical protein [Anaerovoracaceae bacterium]
MKINIKLAGSSADTSGFHEQIIEIPEGSTISQAIECAHLQNDFWTQVHGQWRDRSYILNDCDELLLFFPRRILY